MLVVVGGYWGFGTGCQGRRLMAERPTREMEILKKPPRTRDVYEKTAG